MTSQPSDSFVPLTAAPAPPAAREFRVAVLNGQGYANGHANGNGHLNGHLNGNGAEKKAAFQTLDSLRPAPLHGANGDKKSCEPRVTVQRDGNRVTHLRIQCTCGQVMDLACVYDEAPPA
jgi:hypothetical protein